LFVYLIRNNANGKVYVGKTVREDLHGYFQHNVRNAMQGRRDKNYLYSAIRKHGPDAFEVTPLCRASTEDLLLAIECFYIKHYQSNHIGRGYNLTRGGDGVSGMKQSEYAKQRNREVHTGRKASLETRALLSQRMMGNTRRAGKTAWNKRRPWSNEMKRKMSESAKRRWKNMSSEDFQRYQNVGRQCAEIRWNSNGQ
jgi:group I intron endonuclease